MRRVLFIVWLATIGADRIDFLRGSGAFVLTPFILLSPVVILAYTLPSITDGSIRKLRYPRNLVPFLLLSTLMLAVILASVLFCNDIRIGMKRYVFLLMQICCAACMGIVLHNVRSPGKVLLYGAYVGIVVSLLFDIGQVLIWFGASGAKALHDTRFIDLAPPSLGLFAPRPAGMSVDMNRGGFLLVVYAFFLMKFGARSGSRTVFLCLSVVMLLLTFSRSAVFAFVIMWAALFFQHNRVNPKRVVLVSVLSVAVCGLAVRAYNDSGLASQVDIAYLLAERLSVSSETSGAVHFSVIDMGLRTANASVMNLLLGIGFGNGYLVLGDFFDNQYANFHSLYLSFLVETGIISLIVLLFLLLVPLTRARQYVPIMLGLIAFNVFYQLTLEPILWCMIAMSWMNSGFDERASSDRMECPA